MVVKTIYGTQTHHRRSIRLKGYDYSLEGDYFVTTVTKYRICLFGEIVNAEMHLSKFGNIVLKAIIDLPRHYPNIELNHYVVMPNHVHMIIEITDSGRGGSHEISNTTTTTSLVDRLVIPEGEETRPYTDAPITLSEVIRGFKSFRARRINNLRKSTGSPVWQRSYYERIVRDEHELAAIWDYVTDNPLNWEKDTENPEAAGSKTGIP